MTTPSPRRVLALAAVLCTTIAGIGAASLAPASAAPVTAAYSCGSPSLSGSLDISFNVNITPTTVYVGRTASPRLTLKAKIPGNIVALAAFFGVKSASATGTFGLTINGSPSARPFTFPRTDIPQTSTDFPVTIPIGLPAVSRSTAGTVVYKPGPVAVTLYGYKNTVADAQPGDDVGNVGAQCTSKAPTQKLGTITFVKSATALSTKATYAKATRTVTATAKVVARSGLVPTGSVSAVLYKGHKKVKKVTASLASGVATASFGGVHKKGGYKIVFSYGGSRAMKASTAKRGFTLH